MQFKEELMDLKAGTGDHNTLARPRMSSDVHSGTGGSALVGEDVSSIDDDMPNPSNYMLTKRITPSN